jgi:hypothetical protein
MKNKQQKRKQPRQRQGQRGPRVRINTQTISAGVSTASRITAKQPSRMNVHKNTDRIGNFDVPVATSRGSLIYDQIITPGIASRLRVQASLFQRIKYIALTFEVQTQVATSTSGGYVVAFLKDPNMEVGSGLQALNNLTAVEGTQTSKNWQSVVFNVKPTNLLLYTLSGDDIRWFSPGRLIILSDGPPSSPLAMTVTMNWTVHLEQPALQRLVASFPQVTLIASGLKTRVGLPMTTFNWTPTDNVETNVPIRNGFSGLPPFDTFPTGNSFYAQAPYAVVTAGDVASRFLEFEKGEGQLDWTVTLNYFPSKTTRVASLETRTEFWQGDRFSPVVQSEFLGTANGALGFWSVRQSHSVNQQQMISKEYRGNQTLDSQNQLQTTQAQLNQLAERFQQL